ncbi:MAG TPA: LEA type 2 family protein [Blastocatellia bacterium]|nr:LEA type 2 family protein [Blastocatellia bacterium]
MRYKSSPLPVLRSLLALLFIVAVSSGARAAEDKKPQVTLKRVTVNRVDLSKQTAEATVSVEVDNPGSAFKIKDVSYRLKLNDRKVAEGKHKNEIKVAAASRTQIDVPITVDLRAIPGVTWATISDGFVINYVLETEFTVPVFAFFNHKVKTSFAGDLPLSSLMSTLPGSIKDFLK